MRANPRLREPCQCCSEQRFRRGRLDPAQASLAPYELRACRPRGTDGLQTLPWREVDSNWRSPVAKEVKPFREREPSWRRQKSVSKRWLIFRYRWFESTSLQRRVGRTSNPAAAEHQFLSHKHWLSRRYPPTRPDGPPDQRRHRTRRRSSLHLPEPCRAADPWVCGRGKRRKDPGASSNSTSMSCKQSILRTATVATNQWPLDNQSPIQV